MTVDTERAESKRAAFPSPKDISNSPPVSAHSALLCCIYGVSASHIPALKLFTVIKHYHGVSALPHAHSHNQSLASWCKLLSQGMLCRSPQCYVWLSGVEEVEGVVLPWAESTGIWEF